MVDDDFATASVRLIQAIPAAPKSTAANGTFQLTIDVSAVGELKVLAKGAGTTTLHLSGKIV